MPESEATEQWPHLCALEGPSGCGKSTLLPLVVDALLEAGVNARAVTNNDAGAWGPMIRDLAAEPGRPLTLAFATAGARAEMRETGATAVSLVSDRYVLSSYVYQGFAGVPAAVLDGLNRPLLAGATTILLCCSAGVLADRRAGRGLSRLDWFKRNMSLDDEIDAFEVAAAHLRARGHPVQAMDASGSAAEVCEAIAEFVAPILRRSQ